MFILNRAFVCFIILVGKLRAEQTFFPSPKQTPTSFRLQHKQVVRNNLVGFSCIGAWNFVRNNNTYFCNIFGSSFENASEVWCLSEFSHAET